MDRSDRGVEFLLGSRDPSVRYFALSEVLGASEGSREVQAAKRLIPEGPRMRALFSGQLRDGGCGVHWYKKWGGPHWRLVSAVELGVPAGNEAATRAAEYVLSQPQLAPRDPRPKAGLRRVHASVPGNAVGVCSRLGLADNPRVGELARSLAEWQWPDGGWNCDGSAEAHHSSFYESLSTLWGLNEYLRATGDGGVRRAVDGAAEFFLRHRLFKSCRGERTVKDDWLKLHYPLYWHYDILQALRVLDQAGRLGDPRTKEALDIVASKRSKDGTWHAEGFYWRPAVVGMSPGWKGPSAEVVDWGRDGPNEMITLNALRVLVHSGVIP